VLVGPTREDLTKKCLVFTTLILLYILPAKWLIMSSYLRSTSSCLFLPKRTVAQVVNKYPAGCGTKVQQHVQKGT